MSDVRVVAVQGFAKYEINNFPGQWNIDPSLSADDLPGHKTHK